MIAVGFNNNHFYLGDKLVGAEWHSYAF